MDLAQLIGNFGFPIVMTLILLKMLDNQDVKYREMIEKQDERHRDDEKGWQNALDNNTKVMHEIVNEIKRGNIKNENKSD